MPVILRLKEQQGGFGAWLDEQLAVFTVRVGKKLSEMRVWPKGRGLIVQEVICVRPSADHHAINLLSGHGLFPARGQRLEVFGVV